MSKEYAGLNKKAPNCAPVTEADDKAAVKLMEKGYKYRQALEIVLNGDSEKDKKSK